MIDLAALRGVKPDAVYDTRELVAMFGSHPSTLYRWMKQKKLQAAKIGGRKVVLGSSILAAAGEVLAMTAPAVRTETEKQRDKRAAKAMDRIRGRK